MTRPTALCFLISQHDLIVNNITASLNQLASVCAAIQLDADYAAETTSGEKAIVVANEAETTHANGVFLPIVP